MCVCVCVCVCVFLCGRWSERRLQPTNEHILGAGVVQSVVAADHLQRRHLLQSPRAPRVRLHIIKEPRTSKLEQHCRPGNRGRNGGWGWGWGWGWGLGYSRLPALLGRHRLRCQGTIGSMFSRNSVLYQIITHEHSKKRFFPSNKEVPAHKMLIVVFVVCVFGAPPSAALMTFGQGATCLALGYDSTWCTAGCANGKCCIFSACGALNCGSANCCYLPIASWTACGGKSQTCC